MNTRDRRYGIVSVNCNNNVCEFSVNKS